MRKSRFSDDQKREIVEFSLKHGVRKTSEKYDISYNYVIQMRRKANTKPGYRADGRIYPNAGKARLSDQWVASAARTLSNLRGQQVSDIIGILIIAPDLFDELLLLRKRLRLTPMPIPSLPPDAKENLFVDEDQLDKP